jgi:hypothetical protein
MSQEVRTKNPGLISYMTLRRFVGLIGILLPFALVIIHILLVRQLVMQGSMSGYYYTDVRGILVGSLCAIGVFLFAYRGYGRWDNWLTNAAGVFAVGVALFPTAPVNPSPHARDIGYVHFACAGSLFAVLAVISLWLFTQAEPDTERSAQKKKRDLVYRICGGVIVACLVLVPIESLVIGVPVQRFRPLFWLEAVAVVAFGIAWLVKGQAILKDAQDREPSGPQGGEPSVPRDAGEQPIPAGRLRELAGRGK